MFGSSSFSPSGGGVATFDAQTAIVASTIVENTVSVTLGGVLRPGAADTRLPGRELPPVVLSVDGSAISNADGELFVFDSLLIGDEEGAACLGDIEFEGVNFDNDGSCGENNEFESETINLGLLADNGCATTQAGNSGQTCGLTHELLAGSVAIDATPESALKGFFEDGVSTRNSLIFGPGVQITDQRGFIRPQGRAFDIGAFELTDNDFDGIENIDDNCPFVMNNNQADFEGDGQGDLCDDDIDGDGLPNAYETANGLDPFNSLDRDADPDRDGRSNLEEFRSGTDPNVADEVPERNGVNAIVPVIQLLLLSDEPMYSK